VFHALSAFQDFSDSPLATCIGREVYSGLSDPTAQSSQGSTSLVMTKANGDEVGHVLYDGYGAVLTSTLPATLTTTLAGSGDVPDPDTGLVYLGAGRWYDPALGRPLQPNPVGGPPMLPQALNRYAATAWGPPGVAEGVSSQAGSPLLSTFEKAVFKTALTYFGFRTLQLMAVPIVPAWGPLSLRMSRYAWGRYYGDPAIRAWFKSGVKYQKSFYTWELKYRARQIGPDLFEVEEQELLRIRRGTRGAKIEVLYDSYGLNPRIRFLSGAAWAFVLSGSVQLWSDWDDPYFTMGQKFQRAGITGLEGVAVYAITLGGATLLGLNPVGVALLGLGIGFIWFSGAHPIILKELGPPRERKLAPLP
jgi:hypothetical protein